jgi:RES domain-containing protein
MGSPSKGILRAYRIADARYDVFDLKGNFALGSRWVSRKTAVIYAASSYSGALLENLVRANYDHLPRTHRWVAIEIPSSLVLTLENPPDGWNAGDYSVARQLGDAWYRSQSSAVLAVPSVPTGGVEHNLLINAIHPDFRLIRCGDPRQVHWDMRLFRIRTAAQPA